MPLGNPYPSEVILKFRVHLWALATNSEEGLEGFVCLFNMKASIFV